MESERHTIAEIWKKLERGETLTSREEQMLAYSPYGTAARSSFGLIVVDTDEGRRTEENS